MPILIVDDNAINRKLLRAQLEAEKLSVVEAADGIEALEILKREKIEAVISDILMPRMDGYRLCREIRADAHLFTIPFVFYTATYTSPGDEKFSLEVGADVFLKKPAPVPTILKALEKAKHSQRQAKPAVSSNELGLLKEYNERLVAKLEEKNNSLEAAVNQLQRQAIALENAANGVVITDARGIIVWLNPAFTTLTGYTADEALNRTPRILKSGKHDEAFYRQFWQTILSGQTWRGEFTNRKKDSALYYAENTVTPVRDAAGKISHFVGIMHDITARKQAEATLRESEERLRIVTDNARVGLVLVAPDRRYVFANAAYSELLGLSSGDLVGLRVQDVLPDIYEAQIQARLDAAFAGERVAYELRRDRLDGERHYSVKYEPIYAGSTVTGVLVVIIDITKRKQAEASLSLFRALIDRSNDSFEIIDPETGRFFDVNERSCEIHGYTRDEMLSLSVSDVEVEAVDKDSWKASANEIRHSGSKIIEGRHRRKDGSSFPIEAHVNYVRLNRDYLVSVVRDITDRKRTEQALRESEKRFRELAETIHEVFWVTTPSKSQMLYISPAYEKIWGRTCQSLYDSPRSWLEAIHPEDRGQTLEAIATKQTAGTYNEEYRILRPDGSMRWIHDRAFPVRNDAGEVERVVGVAKDITERKLAVDAQRESQRMLEKAQQVARLGSWVSEASLAGNLAWSAETCRIFGFAPGEFDGRVDTFLSLIHPEDRDNVIRASQAALAGLRPYNLEHRIVRRDGQIRWLHEQADVERDETGRPIRLIGVAHDITDRRLLEDQFRQSQKMEAIGQLAGGVAHDFNNILAAVMIHSELLEDENSPEKLKEGLRQIRGYAERAANLTRQLLLFSRRQVMQPRDLDLNEAVTNLSKMLKRMISENVKLELLLHSKPLLVHADAGMVDQILMNLAVNARDAMPNGGRLLIETALRDIDQDAAQFHPDAAPGSYICLSVTDSGTGIPLDVLPRIFEPFFTTKEAGKGTGLGLATVFGIVKQHSGWIKVYSEVGSGTTFQVFLPTCEIKGDESDPSLKDRKSRGGTETILLAEDDKQLRILTRAILERQGYRIIDAANGVEAAALWKEHGGHADLLLTDLVMPDGLGGQELARVLRQDNPRLKVIFVSGYSSEFAGKELQLQPGEHFLQKPVTTERLLETIRLCLDRS